MPSRLEHYCTADGHLYQKIGVGSTLYFLQDLTISKGIVRLTYPSGSALLVKMSNLSTLVNFPLQDPDEQTTFDITSLYVSENAAKIALGEKYLVLAKEYVTKGRLLKLEGLGRSAPHVPRSIQNKPSQVDEDDLPPEQRLLHES